MMDKSDSNKKSDKGLQGKIGNQFLKRDGPKNNPGKTHKDYLGMEVPDGYFSASKESVLKNLPSENKEKSRVLRFRRIVAYPLAASILLLISIAIWLRNDSEISIPEVDKTPVATTLENYDGSDFLLTSLLLEDAEVDQMVDDYLINEIIVKAELSEQQLENIFINSLFENDSLVDEFLDENLIEQVVL